ncbi:hypothetical protein SGRIM128S_08409 [Streptomyces griseomycini]
MGGRPVRSRVHAQIGDHVVRLLVPLHEQLPAVRVQEHQPRPVPLLRREFSQSPKSAAAIRFQARMSERRPTTYAGTVSSEIQLPAAPGGPAGPAPPASSCAASASPDALEVGVGVGQAQGVRDPSPAPPLSTVSACCPAPGACSRYGHPGRAAPAPRGAAAAGGAAEVRAAPRPPALAGPAGCAGKLAELRTPVEAGAPVGRRAGPLLVHGTSIAGRNAHQPVPASGTHGQRRQSGGLGDPRAVVAGWRPCPGIRDSRRRPGPRFSEGDPWYDHRCRVTTRYPPAEGSAGSGRPSSGVKVGTGMWTS